MPNSHPHEPIPASAIHQTELIVASYRSLLGKSLITPPNTGALAEALFQAPFVVASTGLGDDPLLNYGNRCALDLWGLTWDEFTRLPGRRTAEPGERDERERFLSEVKRRGYILDYSGIRVTSRGRRFRIREAVVWNLTDGKGAYAGQAVRFDSWEWL